MNLFPPPPTLGAAPRAESRPPLRLRVLVVLMTLLMVGLAVVGAQRQSLPAVVLGTVAGSAAIVLTAKLCCVLIFAGPGWLMERRLGVWIRLPLDRRVAMTSSQSPLGGDWLFLRHETGASVTLWSWYDGAREVLEAVRDQYLVICGADIATERRLWPDGRPPRPDPISTPVDPIVAPLDHRPSPPT